MIKGSCADGFQFKRYLLKPGKARGLVEHLLCPTRNRGIIRKTDGATDHDPIALPAKFPICPCFEPAKEDGDQLVHRVKPPKHLRALIGGIAQRGLDVLK